MHIILLLGDSNVGKSEFIQTVQGKSRYAFYTREPIHDRPLDAVLIMYDVSNIHSFQRVHEFIAVAQKLNKPFIVVGTKCDLYDDAQNASANWWSDRGLGATAKGLVDPQECALLGVPFCNISSFTGKNLQIPIAHLQSQLQQPNK